MYKWHHLDLDRYKLLKKSEKKRALNDSGQWETFVSYLFQLKIGSDLSIYELLDWMCPKGETERKPRCGCVRPACSSSRACQGSEAWSWRQLGCSARYNATRPGSFASPRAGWETAAEGLGARKRTPWKGLCRGSRTGCKRWERPEAAWRSWRWGWWGLEWLDQSPGKTPWDPWRRCIPDSALWEKCGHHGLPSGSSAKRAAVGISRASSSSRACAEIRVEISLCRSKTLIPPPPPFYSTNHDFLQPMIKSCSL